MKLISFYSARKLYAGHRLKNPPSWLIFVNLAKLKRESSGLIVFYGKLLNCQHNLDKDVKFNGDR